MRTQYRSRLSSIDGLGRRADQATSWGLALLLGACWLGCGTQSDVEGAGTGGASASGGPAAETGGATGSVSTGGATGSGGAPVSAGSGGAPATGGITGTGGAPAATGGAPGTGEAGGPGVNATGGAAGAGSPAGGSTATGQAGAPGGSSSPCAAMPVTPGASAQAKKLLCYIYSLYGNHVLSGQQETSWANPAGDISWYGTNGLKDPAILGGDLMYRDGASCTSVTATTTRAIAYWNAGGLTMIRYHMGVPAAGLTCAQDCYQGTNCAESTPAGTTLDNAVTAGTAENTSLVARLDYIAVQLKAMQDANVPVILALFHEVQPNGWFWWSKGTATQFVALWKYAFDYLTATKGLTNVIWLMPFSGLSGVGAPIAPYFPGKAMVDLSGPDYQNDSATFNKVKAAVGATLPIPLHESGAALNPAAWFPASPFVLWNIWAGYQKTALATVKTAFGDTHTITRDMVPSLK
jgi:hypothetical protein